MSRLIMLLVLMLSATSTWADWTLIGENTDIGMNVYIDYATIRRSGNLVKVWELYDYKDPRADRGHYLSERLQMQYDCPEEQKRPMVWNWHSKNMGKGEVLGQISNSNSNWVAIAPETFAAAICKIVCDKK